MNLKLTTLLLTPAFCTFFSAPAQNWEQTSAPVTFNYPCIACSPDGTTLLLSGYRTSIPVYVSTNCGAAWTMTTAPVGTWDSPVISADNTKLAAVSHYPAGGVYTSIDGGNTWVSNNLPNAQWTAVAASVDGQRLVAANNAPGTIYTSTNGGALWIQSTNAPAGIWRSLASSADGAKLIAARSSPGGIYVSADAGVTWTACTHLPVAYWSSVACSADGRDIVAASTDGPVYTSTDSGNSWVDSNLPFASWRGCTASADADVLLVCSLNGWIYSSTDLGLNWTSNSVPSDLPWNSVAVSADGSQLLAVAGSPNGGLYRSLTTPAPRLLASLTPDSIRLGWLLPARTFVLQQSPDCTPARWQDTTNAPTLNLTNLHYEVSLPLSEKSFYRLKML